MTYPGDAYPVGRRHEAIDLPEPVLDGIEEPWRDALTHHAAAYLAERDAYNGELPEERAEAWSAYLGITPTYDLYVLYHSDPRVRTMTLARDPAKRHYAERLEREAPDLVSAYQTATIRYGEHQERVAGLLRDQDRGPDQTERLESILLQWVWQLLGTRTLQRFAEMGATPEVQRVLMGFPRE